MITCNLSTLRRKSKLSLEKSDNRALTCFRYIFSPHITSFVSISDATLSLATCCIQYLCQRHHDTDLSDDKLRSNIISGIYRLYDYSSTMWLELVEQYTRSLKSTAPSSDFIS